MSARPIVFANLVDAWRHDRCTPALTPFLASVRAGGAGGALMEPFGFNTGPAMFAGVYPDVSNQIQKFWYEPDASPFGFTRWIPEVLTRLPRGSGRLDAWIFRRAEAALAARGVTTGKHLVDFRGVPHRLKRFFNLVETGNHYEPGCLPVPTVFDVLRNHERRFLWIGVPDHQLTVAANRREVESGFDGQDLVFVHWSEPDWLGHAHGPDSPEYAGKLAEIDRTIADLAGLLARSGRPVRVLAYGDHGMAPVKGGVDVAGILAGLAVSCPRDYVYFLDSTAARFWFHTPAARAQIERALGGRPEGRFLGERDRAAYRLPADRRHWDACWMLEEGWVISPDFFHTDAAKPVLGMHGYRPEVPDNQSAWVAGGAPGLAASGPAGARPMVDIASTLCALLELPAPPSFTGAALARVG